MRPLNVLHVIGGGDTGGAMSHLLPLLSALQRTDCNVQLLCLGEGGLADEAGRRGLSVTVLPMNGARDPRVIRPLRRLLAAGPPTVGRTESSSHAAGAPGAPEPRWDVVHTHGMRANLPVRLAMRTLRPRPCLFDDRTLRPAARLRFRQPGPGLSGTRSSHPRRGGQDHLRLRCPALATVDSRLSGGATAHRALWFGEGRDSAG